MLITKKIIGIAAATIVAGTLAAGAASAGIAAPSIDSLPKAEIQNIAHPGGGYRNRRCRGYGYGYGFRRALPRRVIYRRLMRQGFYRIRNLRRMSYVGGWRRMSVYRATASRRFAGSFKRYRLRINACTGRVISARRIGFGWGYGGYGGF